MKKYFLFLHLSLLLNSCAQQDSSRPDSNPTNNDTLVETTQNDTGFRTFQGIVPCADCEGIDLKLKIKDAYRIESYQFVLNETYLNADNGKNKSFESRGFYNFLRGNSTDPNATIIVLNDDSTEDKKRYFMRLGDSLLKLVDQNGDEISSKHNYLLKRIK